MIPEYQKFVNSIALADHNVLIIFGIASLAVCAFYSIKLLPVRAQPAVRLMAWCYAALALTLTVIYSGGL